MASYKFALMGSKKNPQVNQLGLSVIYVLYSHDSRNAYFSTGAKVTPEQFQGYTDPDNPITEKTPNWRKLKLQCQQKKAEITQALITLSDKSIVPTIEAVRSALQVTKPDVDPTQLNLVALLDTHIEDYCKRKKRFALNTIMNYRVCYHRLKEYTDKQYKGVLRPPQVTMKFYNDFVEWLRTSEGMNDNSIGSVIKNLKAFLRVMADTDEGYGLKIPVNLTKFEVLHEEKEVIYLTQEELTQLEKCNFEKELLKEPETRYTAQHLDQARDLFVFVCYTGLRVSDLQRVGKQHNIEGNFIRMKAHKTGKPVRVPILPPVRAILEKYSYQLPRFIEQKYNYRIKVACRLAGIDVPIEQQTRKDGQKIYSKVPKWQEISSHNAVSTFCTQAMERGVPPNQIAEVTGKTVQVLLDRYIGTSSEGATLRAMYKAYGFDMTVS